MNPETENKTEVIAFFERHRKLGHVLESIAGTPPAGATYDDGTPLTTINVGWRCVETGETVAMRYRLIPHPRKTTSLREVALESLSQPKCPACGGTKKRRQSFCPGCYGRLPLIVRKELYGAVGYPLIWAHAMGILGCAVRWNKNGDHPQDYAEDTQGFETTDGVQELRTFTGAERKARGWEGGVVRYYRSPVVDGERVCEHCAMTMHDHGWMDTGTEGQIVCPGDLIVTLANNERHACKTE